MKDWKKSGLKLDVLEKLPAVESKFLTAEELLKKISNTDSEGDRGKNSSANVTLVDLRTEHHLEAVERPLIIKTRYPTIYCLLDDLQKDEIRRKIPREGLVVTITETGNRDQFVIQYLSGHGYKNIRGLLYGMRGWIKAGYETARP